MGVRSLNYTGVHSPFSASQKHVNFNTNMWVCPENYIHNMSQETAPNDLLLLLGYHCSAIVALTKRMVNIESKLALASQYALIHHHMHVRDVLTIMEVTVVMYSYTYILFIFYKS